MFTRKLSPVHSLIGGNLLYNVFTHTKKANNMEIKYVKCGDYYIRNRP